MQEAKALIAETLLEKEKLTPQELNYATKVPLIQVYNVVKTLEKEGLITIEESEDTKHYLVKDAKGLEGLTSKAESEKTEPTQKDKQKEKTDPKIEPSGRHTGKFIFRKIPYSKSQCVYQIVAAFVKEKSPTFAEIEKAFPPEIVSRFGVAALLSKAETLNGNDRVRYHMKDHMILTTSDKKKVVVTNQWSLDRFLKFAEAAAKLGYKVKPE